MRRGRAAVVGAGRPRSLHIRQGWRRTANSTWGWGPPSPAARTPRGRLHQGAHPAPSRLLPAMARVGPYARSPD